MDWQQAKEGTIRYWRGLRDSIDRLDEVELLREINAVNDLCDKAKEEGHGQLDRCEHCIAHQQFGGCMGVSLRMSEMVVDGDLDGLRTLMDRFIGQLEGLKVPPRGDGSPL